MRGAPENLVLSNRVAKDRVDQHPPPVRGEQHQDLPLDFADLHDLLPAQPPPRLPEPRQHAVLVHHAVVAEIDVVAVLHRRRGERAEEKQHQHRERERLDLLRAVREVVEHQRRRGERRRAGDEPRDGRAVEAEDAAHAGPRTAGFPCRIPALMRWTQSFIYTLREVPSHADVVSQKLMMRAGMIRKAAAGIYTYLPLGLRSMQKLEAIIREEMNRAGAVELLGPTIHPGELWMESGRWQRYGKELLRIKDRHERDFVYGPTAEEVVTDAVRSTLNSYRQLPANLYQIQTTPPRRRSTRRKRRCATPTAPSSAAARSTTCRSRPTRGTSAAARRTSSWCW